MRSLTVEIGAGTRCELYYRTDYRGLSTGKDAFMRASLSDLAAVRGNSRARRDALQFIMYHRLGTDTDDPAAVLKNAVRSGQVLAVIEQRRSSGTGSRSSDEPRPRSITFTPSQLFRGTARMARGTGASRPALPRLPAEDGLAIWFAKPGDVLPDGTIATPVATPFADARPFEYTPDAVGAEAEEIAGMPFKGAPGSWASSMPGTMPQLRQYGPNGTPMTDIDFEAHHGNANPHAHNWDGTSRDQGWPVSILP
jgi:hypothetical protein